MEPEKEKIRKEILDCCDSSSLKKYDLSLFDDNDVDVFKTVVSFDTYYDNYYPKLSDALKNNKDIVLKAAKCVKNYSSIPKHFFQDKDVIKAILYARNEEHIAEEYLTEDIVNYMFSTCPRCSDKIKLAINKHLKKETIISVLKNQNQFITDCVKKRSHPCIDKIYLPDEMLKDIDIVKLLFVSHFRMVENNPLIDKEMILSIIDSGYAIEYMPKHFFL